MVQNRQINPWPWSTQFGFSQAIETSGHTRVLRCSGQTPTDANGAPMHAGDMAAQVTLAVDNLETVLKAANMSLANVVRLHLYTTDVDNFLLNFGPLAERLGGAGVQPAMTLIGVARLFEQSVMIEIEAEAVA